MSAERAAQLASAIKAAGIKAGGRVGIYAPNVPNWMLVIQACNRSSLQVGELPYGRHLHAFVDNCLPMPMLEQNPISSPCAHQANCLLVNLCALQASISMSLQCLALTHLMCHLRMLRSRCCCSAHVCQHAPVRLPVPDPTLSLSFPADTFHALTWCCWM